MDLATAQSKWNDIKEWSKSSGHKVSQYKINQQKKIDQEQKTFGDAVYGFLTDKQTEIKETKYYKEHYKVDQINIIKDDHNDIRDEREIEVRQVDGQE